MHRIKQLTKDSIVYGLGGGVGKSITFFMLPVYTRIFSPAEYGTIEMMMIIVNMLVAILVMGMDSAQSFYFFEQKERGKAQQRTVISAILQWRLVWGLIIVITAGGAAPFINAWLFEGSLPWIYFAVAFSGALFVTLLNQSIDIFRLLYRPWPYVAITITHSSLTAILIVVLVLGLESKIFGYFLGTTIASLCIALLGWFLIKDYVDFKRWHRNWWPRLLRFGAPLLPAGLAFYSMSTMDRWFIQHYQNTEELGIYAIGAKFALLMTLVIETFRKAWWPMAMDAMHSDDGPSTFRMISRLYIGVGVALVGTLTLISPWLVKFMTAPAYQSAWVIVGILAWQSLFYGFYLIASAGIWKAKKTYLAMYLLIGAAALNFLLNMVLVPNYGAVGAAVATAITYFVWVFMALAISEKLWKVQFPVLILMAQLAIGLVVVSKILLSDFPSTSIYLNNTLVFIAVIVLLISSLDRELRKMVVKKAKLIMPQ